MKKKTTNKKTTNKIKSNEKHSSAKDRNVKTSSVKNRNVKDNNVKHSSAKDSNVKTCSVKNRNVKDNNVKHSSVKNRNVKDSNVKDSDVIKKILVVIIPLVGLFIELPRYIVNTYEVLRIILLVLMVLGGVLVIICSFQQITKGKRRPDSKYISSIITLWSIVSVILILIVIILMLSIKPDLRIKEDFDTEAFIKMTNGDVYPRISMDSFDYDNDTYFSIDLYNFSDNIIVLKDEDAVEIELLEFTPFEELDIKMITNGEGEIGFLEEPIELVAELTPAKNTYPALFIEDNIKRKPNGAMLKIVEDDTKTLKIHIHPQQEGLYRFRIKLNYSMKGKPKSKYTKEFTLFCDDKTKV